MLQQAAYELDLDSVSYPVNPLFYLPGWVKLVRLDILNVRLAFG